MKGADQCPKCASRKCGDIEQSIDDFYAATIRVCANCGTAGEPFDPADTIDPEDRYASFKTPCGNCAFRKGSHEQRDKESWEGQMTSLSFGAAFYCHKGVPITPGKDHGFAYPEGKDQRNKLRLCRGYLNSIVGPKLRSLSANAERLAVQKWIDPVDEPWEDA